MSGTTFFLLTVLIFIQQIEGNDKIVNGYATDPNYFVYQAYVVSEIEDETIKCGGSIISEDFILTSASCVAKASSVLVRIGITNTSEPEEDYPFIKGTPTTHPRYEPTSSLDFNVAVVKLAESISLSGNTWSVSLMESGTEVVEGSTITVTGWGVTSVNGTENSEVLNAINLTVLPISECAKDSNLRFTSASFCATSVGNDGNVCQGDSGDPAVYSTFQQVGVVSFTSKHGCGEYPSLFANVGHEYIRGWIEQETGV